LALLTALSLSFFALTLGQATPAFATTTLNADGSSWAGPAIEKWRTDVANQGINLNFAPNGSAAGRNNWESGLDDFTASDVPFRSSPDMGASQGQRGGGTGDVENPKYGYSYVPITAGGTAFMYNLVVAGQQVKDLRLSPDTLVGIFTGAITSWDDPKITHDYGRALPKLPITPVIRSDGSGATAQFTRWMEHTHQSQWDAYCNSVNGVACGDYTEFYPPSGRMIAQNGSDQVAHYIEQPAGLGAIGYDEYAFALTSNWPVVKVLNPAGYYSLPTASNVAVALTAAKIRGVDDNTSPNDPSYLQQNLDGVYSNQDPRSYPVSSYSYLIVPRAGVPNMPPPPRFNNDKGSALSQYLDYVLCGGQATGSGGIDSIGYSPIPRGLVRGGLLQVQHIPGASGNVDPNTLANCPNPTFDSSGQLIILKNAPQPNQCDKQGMPLNCDRNNPAAGGGGTGGSGGGNGTGGSGGSGGGNGTGGNGTGGTGGGNGTGGSGGSGGGNGTGGTGGGNGTGGSGGSGGGNGTTIDPQTGEVVQNGGDGTGGASTVAASSVNVGGRPDDWVLTTLTALELLAVIAVPPFLGGWLRRRRAGAAAGGPR
jgi:ABC-type phosphate transport system substrate-binding protein